MVPVSPLLAGLLWTAAVGFVPLVRGDEPSASQRSETLRRHALDPATSLDSRVRETPASVLKTFEDAGMTSTKPHPLTEEEHRKLLSAFAGLPPLHRRVLGERLRSVSFLDGMPNTALTSTVNPDEPYPLFDITIRAGILHEDVSQWCTQKERTCFDAAGSSRSVSVDAGKLDALFYVLLHEATHVVDASLQITPPFQPAEKPAAAVPPGSFVDGIWADRLVPASPYRDPLLDRIRFRAGGKPLPIDQAEAVYQAMGKTPFASLYGSSNWHDDLAESVALHHMTEVLKQPYRIVIRSDGKEVFVYEPMKTDLVRKRFGQMARFYE